MLSKRSSILQLLLGYICFFLIFFIGVIRPLLGMEVESIEILSSQSAQLKKQTSTDCDHKDGSAYNKCYGRGMVFRVLPSPAENSWRFGACEDMRKFSKRLQAASIGANPVVTSFYFRCFSNEEDNIRFTLPYLYLSGGREHVSSRIYFMEDDATRAELPSFVKSEVSQALRGSSLEHFFDNCFPKDFFPCHFKGPVFVLHPNNDPKEQRQPALEFRRFLYSEFVGEEEYEAYKGANQYMPFIRIINNLMGYTHGCTGEEIRGVAHDFVLDLALMESYLREIKKQTLLDVFGVQEIDDLFNQGSHDGTDDDKGMSYCFHHSEQALVHQLLEGNKLKNVYHNDLIALMIDYLKNFLSVRGYIQKFKVSIIEEDSGTVSEPTIADELLSSDELITKSTPKSLKKKSQTNELTVQIEDKMVVDMDIVSQRLICKYCRGSLYFCKERIATLLRDTLIKKGLIFTKSSKKGKDGKASKAEECYERMAEFIRKMHSIDDYHAIIIRFSHLDFNLIATAVGENVSSDLMGKMEINHEQD